MADLDDELFALAGGDDDADVEEGEASSVAASSPNSLGSDAMDESDSDRDDDVPERSADVPYPLEGRYIDAADKAKILAMTQLEREAILGQRAEEMNAANFRVEIARRAAMQNDRKRKADSDEPEDSMRKSSRQKVKVKTNDKLEAYKREREQRGQQRQRQDDRRNGRRRSSSTNRDRSSDVDADGESDVEYDDHAKQAPREEQPAMLRHFESVRVGRGFFSKVCFYPGFEDTMTGTFGRIGVGQDNQRRTLYKMAQIKGFSTGKPYVFEGHDGKRLATDQYVVAQHGSTKKEYQFQFLSNQPFTDSDLDAYKQSLTEMNAKVPTQTFLKKKFDDLKKLENRYWSDDDINQRLKKAEKYKHLLFRNNSDNPAPKIATQSEAASARIAELNRNNRRLEQERIHKALIEERRQAQMARKKEAARKKAEEETKAKTEAEKLRKKNLEVDALFDGDSSRASTPKPQEKKKTERKGLPTFSKPKMDDDIIASMDIGVDIEI